ncbi:hypothetical protein X792_04905 [Dehalococcoides mccartyi CG1]|jgi:hypothetical protein|nr:hypothetical protein X792_04905 [Dehalococcoides mccartyi CG1]
MARCSKCKQNTKPLHKYYGMRLCKPCLDIVTHPEWRMRPTPNELVLARVLNGLARRPSQHIEPELVTEGEQQG